MRRLDKVQIGALARKVIGLLHARSDDDVLTEKLAKLNKLLNPEVRAYTKDTSLYLYANAGISIPRELMHAADYVEFMKSDGPFVHKNKWGLRGSIQSSTERQFHDPIDMLIETVES